MALYADKAYIEQKEYESNLAVINEAYFGRMAINELYNAYADWREPLVSKNKYCNMPDKLIYNDNMIRFRNLVCKQFGFDSFSYVIIPSSSVNSFTFAPMIPDRRVNAITIDRKKGYRFKEGSGISAIVAVFPDLVFNPVYTTEENFAVFLHEIGHNFQAAASNLMYSLTFATAMFSAVSGTFFGRLLVNNDITFTSVSKVFNTIFDNKATWYLFNIVNMVLYTFEKVKSFAVQWAGLLLGPLSVVLYALNNLRSFLFGLLSGEALEGYYGERFADGFPASYGFGEAATSGEMKLARGNHIVTDELAIDFIEKVPIAGHIINASMIPGLFLLGIVDVHPDTISRCHSVITDLKTDLKDPNLPPELKKSLAKDIDNCEKSMNKFFAEGTKIQNTRFFANLIDKWVYEHGGSVKYKLSELPLKKVGGLRGETNLRADSITQAARQAERFKIV